MLDDSRRVSVDIKGVAKHHGEGDARVDALRTLDLAVHTGGVVAPLGSSGSGKTALLNIIGCIIDPSEGQDSLDGEMVNDNNWLRGDLRRPRLDQVDFIFQAHNLLPIRNATYNVALALQLAGKTASEAQTRAQELLDYPEVGDHVRAAVGWRLPARWTASAPGSRWTCYANSPPNRTPASLR